MGLLDRLFGALGAGDRRTTDRDSDDEPPRADATPPGPDATSNDGADSGEAAPLDPADIPEEPAAIVEAIRAAQGVRRRQLGWVLLERAAERRDAFADEVGALLELLEGDAAKPAAAALGHLADHDPSLLASHDDALVAALDHDERPVREYAADALGHLARAGEAPVEALLDHLADPSRKGRTGAAAVLGVAAAEDPAAISADALDGLDEGDDLARAAATYLRSVLTDEGHVGVGTSLTALVDVAEAAADVDAMVGTRLRREAIAAIAADEAPESGVQAVRIDEDSTGTRIHVAAEDPDGVDPEALTEAVEADLDVAVDGVAIEESDT